MKNTKSDKNFYQHWKHSMEESHPEGMVFRPENFTDFPPARYRESFEFRADGTCRYLALNPVDAHSYIEGKWTTKDNEQAIEIYSKSGELYKRFFIIELQQDKMVIKILD